MPREMDYGIKAARAYQRCYRITVAGIQLVKVDLIRNSPAMTTVQRVDHADSVTRSQ
jgi:hypothetical protein